MLDLNIKSGNSLITDEFNWEKEFPEVFNRGGFDIVVGNPPYLRQEAEAVKKIKPILKKEYKCYHGQADLSAYFFEKALNILKPNGIMGYICTKSYERAGYGIKLRTQILENNILKYVDHNGEKLFNATVNTSSIFIQKAFNKNNEINVNNEYNLKQEYIDAIAFNFDKKTVELRAKIANKGTPIEDLDIEVKSGLETGDNTTFIIDEKEKEMLIKRDNKNSELIKPLTKGENIRKYQHEHKQYVINTYKNMNVEKEYPDMFKYLTEKQANKENKKYNIATINKEDVFEKQKIIVADIAKSPRFSVDNNNNYIDRTANVINSETIDLKTIVGLLNSKVIFYYFKQIAPTLGQSFRFKPTYIKIRKTVYSDVYIISH